MTIAENREALSRMRRFSSSVTTTSQTRSSSVERPEVWSRSRAASRSARIFSVLDFVAVMDKTMTIPVSQIWNSTIVCAWKGSDNFPVITGVLMTTKAKFHSVTSQTLGYFMPTMKRKRNVQVSLASTPRKPSHWMLSANWIIMMTPCRVRGMFDRHLFKHVVAKVRKAIAPSRQTVWPSVIHRGLSPTMLAKTRTMARMWATSRMEQASAKPLCEAAARPLLTSSSSSSRKPRKRHKLDKSRGRRQMLQHPPRTTYRAARKKLKRKSRRLAPTNTTSIVELWALTETIANQRRVTPRRRRWRPKRQR
mmetsp:Transcript_52802/g.148120  ORF Transcript_52802/g.148120 Transcript_52802/m.148120 type:complete len:308 (-) Transcript_52802:8-931(-)